MESDPFKCLIPGLHHRPLENLFEMIIIINILKINENKIISCFNIINWDMRTHFTFHPDTLHLSDPNKQHQECKNQSQ